LAISGIAGPDGGSEEKPVGLVWIALAGPDGISSHRFIFGKERSRNIRRAALMALDLLRKELIDTNFAD
jgi:nicotinamide-nucleotide amidase